MKRLSRPQGGSRLAAIVFSAFLGSCAGPAGAPMAPRYPAPREAPLAGEGCAFSEGVLSYPENGKTAEIRLDAPVREAERVMCGSEFSVIICHDSAVVSLGGEAVRDGHEMLGMIGGRFVPANSYTLNLGLVDSEGGGRASEALSGETLRIRSKDGRAWTISLSDPFGGWRVY